MNSFKKTLALVVAIVMALGMVALAGPSITFTDVPEDATYRSQLEVMRALGVLIGDDAATFRPEESISRAEFAKIVCFMVGVKDQPQGTTRFTDVPSSHWASGYVNFASNYQGIINGYGDGRFGPDDKVTYEQAIKMLVSALGYGVAAAQKGGWPTGYWTIAGETQILKSYMNVSGVAEAKRKDIAVLLYNALEVPLMEQVTYGGTTEWRVMDGSSFLTTMKSLEYNKLGFTRIRGDVVATEFASIQSSGTASEDHVRVNLGNSRQDNVGNDAFFNSTIESFKVGVSDAEKFLGFKSEIYVGKDEYGEYYIAYIRKDPRVDVVTIPADKIMNVIDGSPVVIEYDEGGRYYSRLDVDPSAEMVYNGKNTFSGSRDLVQELEEMFYITEEGGKLFDGYVEFIRSENNGTGYYDSVFVHEAKSGVVDTVNTTSYKITFKNDDQSMNTLTLDPTNKDVAFTLKKDGKDIALSEIKEWDILNVYRSQDEELVNIVVGGTVAEGTIAEAEIVAGGNSFGKDSAPFFMQNKYTIDGKEYQLAYGVFSRGRVDVGDEVKAYVNLAGKITAFEIISKISDNYAFVNEVATLDGISGGAEVQFIDKNGDVKIASTTSKLSVKRWNGSEYASLGRDKVTNAVIEKISAADFITTLGGGSGVTNHQVGQLWVVRLNGSGYIDEVILPFTTSPDIDGFSQDTNPADSQFTFKKSSNKFSGSAGTFYIGDETILFNIAEGDEDFSDSTVTKATIFKDNEQVDKLTAYDFDDGNVAAAIVAKGATASVSDDTAMAVVTGVGKTYNADGDSVSRIRYLSEGDSTEKSALTSSKLGTVSHAKGDVLQLAFNGAGEIDAIRVLARFDASKTPGEGDMFDNATYSPEKSNNDLMTVAGAVYRNKYNLLHMYIENKVSVRTEGAADDSIGTLFGFNYTASSDDNYFGSIDTGFNQFSLKPNNKPITVYLYDPQNKSVSVGSISDIETNNDEFYGDIFLRFYEGDLAEALYVVMPRDAVGINWDGIE